MRKNKGITLVSMIGYIVLSLMIISALIVITTNFKKNFNELDVQSIHDVEFDKINLQILGEIKEGKVVSQDETTKEMLVFVNDNVYTYVKEENSIYLNDTIKIADSITNCEFEIEDKTNSKILKIITEIDGETRTLEYLIEEKEHNWKSSNGQLKCSNCGRILTIGDYIKYVPDEKSEEVVILANQSGYSLPQEIKQEKNSKWRVLAVEDNDNNGTNETLILKMNATVNLLYLEGAKGYINGPAILNEICEELYSSTIYGKARSININDLNYALGYEAKGGFYYDSSAWRQLNNFTTSIGSIKNYDLNETPDGKILNDYKASSYFYDIEGGIIKNPASGATRVADKDVVNIIANEAYWLASQGNLCSNQFVTFGTGYVSPSSSKTRIWGNYDLFNSAGVEKSLGISFVPIVKLNSLVPDKITEDEIGKEEEHDWTKSLSVLTCKNCGKQYRIGQAINYVPDINNKSITINTTESGYAQSQTIRQETGKKWIVIGAVDSDDNGTNEKLVIRMEQTTTKLYLNGKQAYNNGPDIMNRICNELYSSSIYGEARSINIDDLNNALNYIPKGGEYYENGWKELKGFKMKLKELSTWENIKNYTNTPDGVNTIQSLEKYEVNGYFYMLEKAVLTNLATQKKLYYNSEDFINSILGDYWLASKGVLPDSSGRVYFGPGYITTEGTRMVYTTYESFSNLRRRKNVCEIYLPCSFTRFRFTLGVLLKIFYNTS